ncbi:cell division cycle 7-related protein kinase-like [Thrips palmi]|uniref:non-specific serine/threonine protein kinase n=1 Tax=Thrips palmi TaxID=161013 RepID=A0A6P8Z5M1_THRPL|nr:cell division cycle 7-related protein kinase-like [Thrips palmi]
MEVLTSYPHHQLGADLVQHNLYGVEPAQPCANEVSKHQAPHPLENSNITAREHGSEEEVHRSQEKDSDVGEVSQSGAASKSSKKNKERAQIDYLLSSLPAVSKFFKVHGKIGEGTFSSVFLASLKEGTLKHQFAIKHLIPTTHPTRAERELKCLQDIGGCDNVVGVHFCMRYHDSIAFIMPYLPHKRFHEYVMLMGVAETRNYMKQLLLALRRVHSFNIIHRDVKPSNFLYDREAKQFLLVDFGLSQPVEETSKMVSILPEESRKRKREKEPVEDTKFVTHYENFENPAKRPALALSNSTNIIKTPDNPLKMSNDVDLSNKSNLQQMSSRAKRLQNITNKNCTNTQRTFNAMHFKSPVKDAIESSQSRKTPRKNKHHPNTENISPTKCENENQRLARFGENPTSSNEKQALDLRKVKVEAEEKPPSLVHKIGSRSSLQRKILFDDVPDDNVKKCDSFPPRFPLMAPSRQVLSQTLNSNSRSALLNSPLPADPITLSPNGSKEFRTLAPENTKDDVAGSSIVRVQNSQVKSQQMSPVTPNETRMLKVFMNGEKNNEKDHKIVFAKPQAPSANGSVHRTNTPSSPHCNCVGRSQVCTICLSRKPHNAPRAGTPGFRPPEVLLRSPLQSTAVDMWAVGVILLCVLSGCYPFFRSPDDLTALAEIMTVFGTDKIKETAKRLGRMVVCSQPSQPLDLKKLCIRMRQRRKDKSTGSSSSSSSEKCSNCCQPLEDPSNCLCLKEQIDALKTDPLQVNNVEEADDVFPDSAYHLLARLLDLDADTRITAAQALEHPFVVG